MLHIKHLAVAAVSLLIGVGVSSPAFAEWRTNYDAAREAMKNKDYRNAENAAIEALNEADAFDKTDERRLATLEVLSDIYRKTRQWAAAASLLEQIIQAMETLGTNGSPEAGYVYNKLGVTYHQMHDDTKAQINYETALAIKRKRYKDNVTSIATVVTNLGELYRRKQDWTKAEELQKQAIADKESELGPDHPSLVASFNNLALVYKQTKRYGEAVSLLLRAKEISAKGDNNGRNQDSGTVIHNLADIYSIQGKNKEAKALYEEAISMRKEVLGPKHPKVAESLNNYGGALLGLDMVEAALGAYDEAIEIRKLEYGSSDRRTTLVMNNKVMTLERLKRSAEAQKLREEIKQLEQRRQNR